MAAAGGLLPCSVTVAEGTGFTYPDMDGHCLWRLVRWNCEIPRYRADSGVLLLCPRARIATDLDLLSCALGVTLSSFLDGLLDA